MRSRCTRHLGLVALFGLLSLTLIGCASDSEHVEKRLAKLQEEIVRIQSQTDRMSERLDAVELSNAASAARSDERTARAAAGTVARPKLKVVRLEPDSGPEAPEAPAASTEDDDAPRVVIQGEGKALESRTIAAPAKAKTPAKAPAAKSAD